MEYVCCTSQGDKKWRRQGHPDIRIMLTSWLLSLTLSSNGHSSVWLKESWFFTRYRAPQMIVPFIEPKTDKPTSMDVTDPAQGPKAALVASMATTPETFITATTVHNSFMWRSIKSLPKWFELAFCPARKVLKEKLEASLGTQELQRLDTTLQEYRTSEKAYILHPVLHFISPYPYLGRGN